MNGDVRRAIEQRFFDFALRERPFPPIWDNATSCTRSPVVVTWSSSSVRTPVTSSSFRIHARVWASASGLLRVATIIVRFMTLPWHARRSEDSRGSRGLAALGRARRRDTGVVSHETFSGFSASRNGLAGLGLEREEVVQHADEELQIAARRPDRPPSFGGGRSRGAASCSTQPLP